MGEGGDLRIGTALQPGVEQAVFLGEMREQVSAERPAGLRDRHRVERALPGMVHQVGGDGLDRKMFAQKAVRIEHRRFSGK